MKHADKKPRNTGFRSQKLRLAQQNRARVFRIQRPKGPVRAASTASHLSYCFFFFSLTKKRAVEAHPKRWSVVTSKHTRRWDQAGQQRLATEWVHARLGADRSTGPSIWRIWSEKGIRDRKGERLAVIAPAIRWHPAPLPGAGPERNPTEHKSASGQLTAGSKGAGSPLTMARGPWWRETGRPRGTRRDGFGLAVGGLVQSNFPTSTRGALFRNQQCW